MIDYSNLSEVKRLKNHADAQYILGHVLNCITDYFSDPNADILSGGKEFEQNLSLSIELALSELRSG